MANTTGKEMCEELVRYRCPELPNAAVEAAAEKLWTASPTGELSHLIGAYELMTMEQIAAGTREPEPLSETAVFNQIGYRKTPAGCEKMCFDGTIWRSMYVVQPPEAGAETGAELG